MRVLIVEDEPLIAASIEWELRDRGHEVLGPAASAAHAEDLARDGAPDLALVDINLVNRGDGVRLAHALRRIGVASVFVTGQVCEARENRDAALGLLAKPFPVESLDAVVRAAATLMAGGRPTAPPPCLELFAPFQGQRPRQDRSPQAAAV
ncbi:MAG: response regulator [Phenylobacterium sp.]|nr:MAG: response regulator [Phenylobacterium sp.]